MQILSFIINYKLKNGVQLTNIAVSTVWYMYPDSLYTYIGLAEPIHLKCLWVKDAVLHPLPEGLHPRVCVNDLLTRVLRGLLEEE